MPVRPRRQRRHRSALTAARMLALTIGPHPRPGLSEADDTDDTLRAVWHEHRAHVEADRRPGSRSWAWWRFEAGVPEPLRGERPTLVPFELAAQQRAERDDLALRRAVWLAEHDGASGATNPHPGGA